MLSFLKKNATYLGNDHPIWGNSNHSQIEISVVTYSQVVRENFSHFLRPCHYPVIVKCIKNTNNDKPSIMFLSHDLYRRSSSVHFKKPWVNVCMWRNVGFHGIQCRKSVLRKCIISLRCICVVDQRLCKGNCMVAVCVQVGLFVVCLC